MKNLLHSCKNYIHLQYKKYKAATEKREEEEKQRKETRRKKMEAEIKTLKKDDEQQAKTIQYITTSYMVIVRFWIVGIAIAYLGYLAFQTLDIIYLVFAALIISMAMEAGIYKLAQYIKRGPAIIICYILFMLFVFSGVIILIPFIVNQLSLVVNMFVEFVARLIQVVETGGLDALLSTIYLPEIIKAELLAYVEYEGLSSQLATTIKDNLSNIVNISKNLGEWAGTLVVDVISLFFNSMVKVGIVVVLAVFFSIEKDQLVKFLAGIAGPKQRVYWELKLQTLYKKLGQWLQSQVIVSLFIGTLVYIILWIISPWVNLDGKFSLALIAALTAIIPYLGPILGAIPALIAATIGYGFLGILMVILAYGFVQQVEGNFFTPFFMKRQLGISPVLILLVILLGGITLGFVGVVLAVPLAVIITLLVSDDFK